MLRCCLGDYCLFHLVCELLVNSCMYVCPEIAGQWVVVRRHIAPDFVSWLRLSEKLSVVRTGEMGWRSCSCVLL